MARKVAVLAVLLVLCGCSPTVPMGRYSIVWDLKVVPKEQLGPWEIRSDCRKTDKTGVISCETVADEELSGLSEEWMELLRRLGPTTPSVR